MRTRQTTTISLPPAMIQAVEKVRKAEQRTRSELVREALRAYFSARRGVPSYLPTAAELRDIAKGRAEIRRGEYDTLDALRATLAGPRRKVRSQERHTRASARA